MVLSLSPVAVTYYDQALGNVFERRESKRCAGLMKRCRKVKGEKVIILQMAQQLKTKKY